MSLFHAGGSAVTLVYADEKWTRTTGTAMCGDAHGEGDDGIAEYPMPTTMDDPILGVTGRGTETRRGARARVAAISRTRSSAPATDSPRVGSASAEAAREERAGEDRDDEGFG